MGNCSCPALTTICRYTLAVCGIVGFVGEDEERIERLTMALRHRGPDRQRWEVTHGASIGNARLAILDPRPEGDQPMWNDARTIVITYNGEVYNYRELRERYGLRCRTGTDTEVLLQLYERHGIDAVRGLRGMFAFGLYDTRTQTWHLARDPSGILPLFHASPGGRLHFASELRTLLAAFPQKPTLNLCSLSRYMALQYVPGPETLCVSIEQLPPGTILTHREGRSSLRSFSPVPDTIPPLRTRSEFRSNFPALMDEVVRDHLVADRPLGIFLSGGVDSTVLLHHMVHHAKPPVRTFTVRFEALAEEDEPRFNADANLARKTADHYGTEHRELLLTASLCREVYAETARALGQPNADAVAMAQYALTEEAKHTVSVVLCGAGGDELFGGYPRYRIARIMAALAVVPQSLRRLLPCIPADIRTMSPGPALAARLLTRPTSENTAICRDDWFQPQAVTDLFAERWATLPHTSATRDLMEFDRHTWLPDESLRLADAVTMAHGVECRVPFLDPRVVRASLATPAEWHVGWRTTKALLKQAYTPLLPPHFRQIAKACFFPPLAKWIRRECAPLVEESFDHPRIRELFSVEALRDLFKDHRAHRRYALHSLSSITQLRCWFDTVYDA